MGVATTPTDLSDFRTAFLNAIREATGITATNNIVDRYLNTALHDIHLNWDLPWSIRRATLVTQNDYTTGTISVNQGSTNVTGVSTAWATNNAFGVANARDGGKVVLGSVADGIYLVSGAPTALAMTLNTRFTGSDLSASGYTYFEDEYALESDFFRSLHPYDFADNIPISLVPRNEFYRRYPQNYPPQRPRVATIIQLAFSANTTPQYRVLFHPPPDDFYKIDYDYITSNLAVSSSGTEQTQMTATTDEPIIPLRYRHVLLFHALYHWYRDRKNDTRAAEARSEYVDLMRRISQDVTATTSRPTIRPRTAQYWRQAARPWGPRGKRYDINQEFDRLLR